MYSIPRASILATSSRITMQAKSYTFSCALAKFNVYGACARSGPNWYSFRIAWNLATSFSLYILKLDPLGLRLKNCMVFALILTVSCAALSKPFATDMCAPIVSIVVPLFIKLVSSYHKVFPDSTKYYFYCALDFPQIGDNLGYMQSWLPKKC